MHYSGTGHEGRASRERGVSLVSLVSPSLFPPFSLLPQPTPLTPTSPPSPPCSIRCPPPPPPAPHLPCQTPQFPLQATQLPPSCPHCPPSTPPSCRAASTAPPPPSSPPTQQTLAAPRVHKSFTNPIACHPSPMLSSTRDRTWSQYNPSVELQSWMKVKVFKWCQKKSEMSNI